MELAFLIRVVIGIALISYRQAILTAGRTLRHYLLITQYFGSDINIGFSEFDMRILMISFLYIIFRWYFSHGAIMLLMATLFQLLRSHHSHLRWYRRAASTPGFQAFSTQNFHCILVIYQAVIFTAPFTASFQEAIAVMPLYHLRTYRRLKYSIRHYDIVAFSIRVPSHHAHANISTLDADALLAPVLLATWQQKFSLFCTYLSFNIYVRTAASAAIPFIY